ncbi:MAG: ribosomal protein Thx [Bacteroidetes bacterium]|jgi:ribosomal small subunit protein bTHX|nr:ribosomal protein Thx [Bacteroidota bacterium]
MGKGDQRSKKGKIHIGSYGRLRPRKKATAATGAAAPKKAAKKAAK